MDIRDLKTPALVLDLDKLDRNLEHMASRARALGVALRPHVKTHKCIEIGRRQAALGANGITVSTLVEARAFADNGFDDITWAFPAIPNRLDEAAHLAERVRLRLVVDTPETLQAIDDTGVPFIVLLKVDCGYHRAGLDPTGNAVLTLARKLAESSTLEFGGILSHAGHSYHASNSEIQKIAEAERASMTALANRLREHGMQVPTVSVGSTPTMQQVQSLTGITEARPGNYALFDFTQVALGSCTPSQCAVTVVSTVVSSQPGATHCITDAGALALSKDSGPDAPWGPTMGETFHNYAAGELDPEVRVIAVSQEHGRMSRALTTGTRVRILPNHSCLTVAQFDEFHVAQGNSVIDRWKIWRGR
jgi:D-serine deaminase-like pyridoxal phosphate-dependent protein